MAASSGPDIIDDGLIFCVDAKNRKSYSGSGSTLSDIGSGVDATIYNATFDSSGHFDFDGAEEITWCWSASFSRKPGTKTIFDMCVFSNYKKLKDESTYLNGTSIISNVELKDPIFSKSPTLI